MKSRSSSCTGNEMWNENVHIQLAGGGGGLAVSAWSARSEGDCCGEKIEKAAMSCAGSSFIMSSQRRKAALYFRVFLILDCRVDIFAALSRSCPAFSYTTPVPPPKVRTDPRALFETLKLRFMSLLLSLQGPTRHNNVSAACQELPRK